jgi:serine/threonine-protein kinase
LGTSQPGDDRSAFCQRCGKLWPRALTACPDDGELLDDGLDAQNTESSPLSWDTALQSQSAEVSSLDVEARAASATTGPTNLIQIIPRAPHATVLTAGTRVGDYEIQRKIGEGAMGAVYGAVHPTIGKRVAVKIMNPRLDGDPTAIERFTREARTVASIRHPGIVDVFGFGALEDGRAYLIMEWIDGRSLAAALKQERFGLDDALEILDQIARALEAAHDKGIVHRDLKPDNVFLQDVARERPIVKLLDFGLAKYADDERQVSKTQTGQLLGTPLYMSPEQAKARGVDHRTDIYALGCMAYELICGRVPFNPESVAELLAAHLVEPPPVPSTLWPEIPPDLEALLLMMVAKEPDQRPTLLEIREALSGHLRASSQSLAPPYSTGRWSTPGSTFSRRPATPLPIAPTPPPHADPRAARPRRTLPIVIAVASALAVAAVAFALVRRDHDATPASEKAVPNGSAIASASDNAAVGSSASGTTAPPTAPPPVEPAPAPPPTQIAKVSAPHTSRAASSQPRPRVEEKKVRKVVAEKSVAVVTPVGPGVLDLVSNPPCNIYVDGKSLGLRTPQREIKLPAGPHRITLVNADANITDSFSVEISAAQTTRRAKDYRSHLIDKKPDEVSNTINPFEKKKSKP